MLNNFRIILYHDPLVPSSLCGSPWPYTRSHWVPTDPFKSHLHPRSHQTYPIRLDSKPAQESLLIHLFQFPHLISDPFRTSRPPIVAAGFYLFDRHCSCRILLADAAAGLCVRGTSCLTIAFLGQRGEGTTVTCNTASTRFYGHHLGIHMYNHNLKCVQLLNELNGNESE